MHWRSPPLVFSASLFSHLSTHAGHMLFVEVRLIGRYR
jgi:hypothetical protein